MVSFNCAVKKRVLALVAALSFLPMTLTAAASINLDFISAAAVNRSIVAQFTSSSAGLDSPKLSAVNRTAWDWWYFDVVSTDYSQSLVLTFDLGLGTGVLGGGPSIVPYIALSGTFENGTGYGYQAFASGGALVSTTSEGGASGSWIDTGFSWLGSADMSLYVVTINAPEANISGTIMFNSKAPAHYPCGPNVVGSNLEIGPNIGWANAIPDAIAVVDLQIGDTPVNYLGAGYHDKNWGNTPFPTGFRSWYWGHASFSDYSIVWFDFYDSAGKESISAYASYLGIPLAESCTAGSIVVRPIGTGYPPIADGKFPTGFTIEIPLGVLGTLNVTATATRTILDVSIYNRWIGTVEGSLNGGPVMTGVGLWEEINILNTFVI